MHIAIIASDKVYKYLTDSHTNILWKKISFLSDLTDAAQFDALMNFDDNAFTLDYSTIQIPVIINSVCHTLKEGGHGQHVIRMNGWETFIARKSWEMAGKNHEILEQLFSEMGIKPIWVADEPGFISARVLAMIINEAYFAKEEEVSTENEIDIAMKLGTNYPKGPFEWKDEIGIEPVYTLLQTLSTTDKRYTPAASLVKEAKTV